MKEIILCESLIDALTFWCADYRNVTTSYGVSGFTADHRAAFQKHGTKKVLIAYDRDDAGDKAAAALADELMGMGIECYRVLFPKSMDANEYAAKVKPADRSLSVLLNKAQWLGKGKPPSVCVTQPPPPLAEPKPEPAAKEETTAQEPVLPLAAETATSQPVVPVPAITPGPSTGIEIPTEIHGDEITILQGGRRYRVRGLARNTSHDVLKVNLLVSRNDALHVDTVNLYTAQQRAVFIKQACEELKLEEGVVLKRDLPHPVETRRTARRAHPENVGAAKRRRAANAGGDGRRYRSTQ